jgi:hypothetical protein
MREVQDCADRGSRGLDGDLLGFYTAREFASSFYLIGACQGALQFQADKKSCRSWTRTAMDG